MPRHILFLRLAYQAGMCLLALVAVTLTAIDLTTEAAEWEVTADRVIYWIFVLDYVVRFSISRSKWLFIKEHPWDLLAIIPFDALFRLFRFASLGEILRLARYLDLFSYAMRFTTRIRRFFNTNGFKYICIAALVIILLGAVGIHLAEGMSLPNGIWWSFVTATTVGYGDTYPVTTSGKFLAVFLMLTGIGFVGTLTSTITSFFLSPQFNKHAIYQRSDTRSGSASSVSNSANRQATVLCWRGRISSGLISERGFKTNFLKWALGWGRIRRGGSLTTMSPT